MWEIIADLFQGYMGRGLIMGWFLLCIFVLWKKEKNKAKRVFFLYFPAAVLILFFNPLFARVIYHFVGKEIYYRVLWLLPVSVTIAYTLTLLADSLKGRRRVLFYGVCAVLVMFSGSLIYANVHFHRADNLYHMPEAVVEICDAIEVDGREVMAAFPLEMVQYVRQYTPNVCMPYGREVMVEEWWMQSKICDLMEEDEVVLEELLPLCKEKGCHYVILSAEKEIVGDFEKFDYVYEGEICGYRLYRDTTMYLGM